MPTQWQIKKSQGTSFVGVFIQHVIILLLTLSFVYLSLLELCWPSREHLGTASLTHHCLNVFSVLRYKCCAIHARLGWGILSILIHTDVFVILVTVKQLMWCGLHKTTRPYSQLKTMDCSLARKLTLCLTLSNNLLSNGIIPFLFRIDLKWQSIAKCLLRQTIKQPRREIIKCY